MNIFILPCNPSRVNSKTVKHFNIKTEFKTMCIKIFKQFNEMEAHKDIKHHNQGGGPITLCEGRPNKAKEKKNPSCWGKTSDVGLQTNLPGEGVPTFQHHN